MWIVRRRQRRRGRDSQRRQKKAEGEIGPDPRGGFDLRKLQLREKGVLYGTCTFPKNTKTL